MLRRPGKISFEVTQLRTAGFYPSALQRGWRCTNAKLAAWAEKTLAQGFTVFGLPAQHRGRRRTTNGLVRLNKEIKRRTPMATLSANSASCLQLLSAILAEPDEESMTAKIHLNMKP